MSTETTPPAATPAASTPPVPNLSPIERRILGVLVEKSKTTPDAYPLSVNSLVAGCNQKSNRDPVMSLGDVEVEECLAGLQQKGLVTRITGSGRVERWRHNVYEAFAVSKVEAAVVTELLLRGPQTEGELRGRVSRMDPIDDLDTLRTLLKPLAQRGLVVFLGPEGRRGTQLTHGFHAAQELEHLRANVRVEDAAVAVPSAEPVTKSADRLALLESTLEEALQEIATLKSQLAQLTDDMRALKQSLGA